MTKKEKQNFKELEQARERLSAVKADLAKNQALQAEIRKSQQEREARKSKLVIRAQSYLDGETETEQTETENREFEGLLEREQVLKEAFKLQSQTVDKLARDAAQQLRSIKHGEFCTIIQGKVDAIKNYYKICEQEKYLRKHFKENGLPDVFPFVGWPGLRPDNFERESQAMEHVLKSHALADEIKI